jgi:polyhydroxyalkanoate synthesis regulator phasin
MAQPELWRRLLDAGSDLTEMTQKRAEQLVQSLVDAGEVQVDQAQKAAQELVERSRENRSRFLKAVDREVQAQVSRMGLATKADVDRLERKLAKLEGTPAKAPAKKKASAQKKAPAKKKAAGTGAAAPRARG